MGENITYVIFWQTRKKYKILITKRKRKANSSIIDELTPYRMSVYLFSKKIATPHVYTCLLHILFYIYDYFLLYFSLVNIINNYQCNEYCDLRTVFNTKLLQLALTRLKFIFFKCYVQ